MTPFLVGFFLGGVFIACVFIIFMTRKPPPPRTLDPWTEEYHSQPRVVTKLLINKREINL